MSTEQFYDGFADTYRFIYMDWEQSVERQATMLHEFLGGLGVAPQATVWDCTCGIGTQAIALAMQGYKVYATDISEQSVIHARSYAQQFNTTGDLQFAVADLLEAPAPPSEVDVALAFDNPIAHFQTDTELQTAFANMTNHLKSGGLLTTSLRDYDVISQEKPHQSHIRVHDSGNSRRVMFQVWDWKEDASGYESEMFVVTRDDEESKAQSYHTNFRAWLREEVTAILNRVGLTAITWHMPDQSGFYQPIVTAKKP